MKSSLTTLTPPTGTRRLRRGRHFFTTAFLLAGLISFLVSGLTFSGISSTLSAAVPDANSAAVCASFPMEYANLKISETGSAALIFPDAQANAASALYRSEKAFLLRTADDQRIYARKADFDAEKSELTVSFEDGSVIVLSAAPQKGFVLFNLQKMDLKTEAESIELFRLGIPKDAKYVRTINNCIFEGKKVGVMTASVNVRPIFTASSGTKSDQKECSHNFIREKASPADGYEPGESRHWAVFSAESKRTDKAGWNVRGIPFTKPKDLTGCKAIRAWVCGDSKTQSLKIQLHSKDRGIRDDYVPIDFTGWRQVTLEKPALNTLKYDSVHSILFYFNGLPANESVSCKIDEVEAVCVDENGKEFTVMLEDFESPYSALWNDSPRELCAVSYQRHGFEGAAFAVVAAPEKDWKFVIQDLQKAANLPSPRPGGGWRNDSPWLKQSYFFLTNFKEDEYEAALKIAKLGNFKQILLLQSSWCQSTGHYEVNRKNFKDGIDGLRETIEKFQKEGMRFGLHLLSASIDRSDPYLTPVPDSRLVLGVQTELAEDLPADADFIPTVNAPTDFPLNEPRPYTAAGQTLKIGDELITYEGIESEGKPGFSGCKRGFLGTNRKAHKKGTPVFHLVRSYGYYMYDINSTLLPEVAANFAELVNQLPIDMLYFDGSERLQRPCDSQDHWYFNAKMHRAFYDAVSNKDIQYQASSFSPYSWNLLTRSASADGHDDLKAYLDERSPSFTYFEESEMPLDVGWYYGYDKRATPDMYEYVLGATIGYDSSMSFQVSPSAAFQHPFIYEILDLIRKYEELRLSGRIPPEVREKFRIDPILGGLKTEEARNALLDKRIEFHLIEENGKPTFVRMIYPLWHDVTPEDPSTQEWELEVTEESAAVGFQIQFKASEDAELQKAVLKKPCLEINGTKFILPMDLTVGQYGFAFPGEQLKQYGLPLEEPKQFTEKTPCLKLAPGKYRVKFTCAEGSEIPVRIRIPMMRDERYVIE